MKQNMMRNHLEAQERLKGKLRNVAEFKREERGPQEVVIAAQDKVSPACEQGAIKSRDDNIGADQQNLLAPAECENPRTPTPDYADLNARFVASKK